MKRIPGLDALRGLAALSVVFCHCIDMLRDSSYQAAYTPVFHFFDLTIAKTLTNGLDAVLLFFMHSGFVLVLPFLSSTVAYHAFIVKRIFRIYPAHLVVISALLLLVWLIHPHPLPDMGEWFNRKCTIVPTLVDVLKQFSLIGLDVPAETTHFNGVIWSLVHEMRISLIFPLLALLYIRRPVIAQLLAIVLWPTITAYLQNLSIMADDPIRANFVVSFGYIQFFLVGIFLAEHRHGITQWWQRATRSTRAALLVLAIVCYAGHTQITWSLPFLPGDATSLLLALAVFVAAAANGEALFMARIPQWLGRISYSLYLVHVPILVLYTRLLHNYLPIWVIWLLVIGTSLALAHVLFLLIEAPFQQFGRFIANKMVPPEKKALVPAGVS